MKSSLIAIGVEQGDAFFLETYRGDRILIDGGRSQLSFPTQFQTKTQLNGVDIVVCTHNDADHARGILGFLRSGLGCKEVWLPGSWSDKLVELVATPLEFTESLFLDVKKLDLDKELSDIKSEAKLTSLLQVIGDKYADQDANDAKEKGRAEDLRDTDFDSLSEAIEGIEDNPYEADFWWYPYPIHPGEGWPSPFLDMVWHLRNNFPKRRLFLEAITASALVRDIAITAHHRGIKIRWFEFDSRSSHGGNQDSLIPLNSREIATVQRGRWPILKYIALTTSNKESLVFLSPGNRNSPPVLFSADSDLSFSSQIQWQKGMVVTAPHHGSEANLGAYQRFAKETSNELQEVWVRSDGHFKKRPGPSFLNVKGTRYCTVCRGSDFSKQDVRLVSNSDGWKPISSAIRSCMCS